MQDFTEWLQDQIDLRSWTKSELSRRSGVDTGTISNVLNGIRKPGPEVCRAFAQALKLPETVIFYQAGLLSQNPHEPTHELHPVALDILRMVEHRSQAEQAAAKAALEALFDAFDQGKRGKNTE